MCVRAHSVWCVPAIAALLGAAGCLPWRDQEPDRGCEPGPPVSEDATVAYVDLSVEFCHFVARCIPELLVLYHGGDLQGCIDYERCTGRRPEDWKVTPECIEAVRAVECDGDISGTMYQSTVCALGGPIPSAQRGEACHYHVCRGDADVPVTPVRCDEGLYCGPDDVCLAYVAVDQPCSIDESPGVKYDPCEPGTYCNFDDGRCRAELEVGDPCAIQTSPGGTFEIDPCASPATCRYGTCFEPDVGPPPSLAEAGEVCQPSTGACRHGLACVDSVCQELVCNGPTGSPCTPGSCAEELTCNSRTERCEPRGEDCDGEELFCEEDQFCDDNGTCQSLP